MADHAFGLGYRRYEWKCDALNAPSGRAAERLGFTHEGTFRRRSSSRAATATRPGSPGLRLSLSSLTERVPHAGTSFSESGTRATLA
jgi:RimJ/RimL family protein N-acetyltransferase